MGGDLTVTASAWMKFYPSDWRADPRLRICSVGARGLWMEMLCLMHEADPIGHLIVNDGLLDDIQIGILAGSTPKETAKLLAELEKAGVFSRSENGTIYSRRMVRDAEKARKDKENGGRGGNPNITKGVNPPDNGEDKAQIPDTRSQIDSVANATGAPAKKFEEIPEALEAYNVVARATGWPEAKRLRDDRRRGLRSALARLGGLGGWADLLARAKASPFLRGDTGRGEGHAGWRPDLDFILKPKSIDRILEGTYAPVAAALVPVHDPTADREPPPGMPTSAEIRKEIEERRANQERRNQELLRVGGSPRSREESGGEGPLLRGEDVGRRQSDNPGMERLGTLLPLARVRAGANENGSAGRAQDDDHARAVAHLVRR